jgi:predicted nucleic acid-binding protein
VTVVLDSWAVLRFLEDEGSAAISVADLISRTKPLMSWINLGEVHYVLTRRHGDPAATETVRDLRDVIDVRLPNERLVLDAARIKAETPMAYADAFAAALTVANNATLWTGDPELLVHGAAWQWRDLRSTAR